MKRTRRARMLTKLLWLLSVDYKADFIANVDHTVRIYFAGAGKNIRYRDMKRQLIEDYEYLVENENGIADEMFS